MSGKLSSISKMNDFRLSDTTGLVGARGYRDHQRPRARAEKVPVRTDGVTITTSA